MTVVLIVMSDMNPYMISWDAGLDEIELFGLSFASLFGLS
jgi:hypothetical protein